MIINTRFAPSPTGYLHIGNIHTALYSWILARKYNGRFLLRIEDTDLKRIKHKYIKNIFETLKWLGLDWDEKPYFQSKRFNRYYEIIDYMLNKKIAYKCYCSKDRLNTIRNLQINENKKPRYDGFCKDKILNLNIPYVIRFANPNYGSVIFDDIIRGKIKFENKELDDLIICRADGNPTYNFCVIIDDFDMKITHVIRGEDHINNTPRQINILKALNMNIPKYAHTSIILDENRQKLCKRNGDLSIKKYKEKGFIPEALINYILKLDLCPNNKKIFSIQDIKKNFNIKKTNKSSSCFNKKKLICINHYFIKNLSEVNILNYFKQYIKSKKINIKIDNKLKGIIHIFKKRSKTLEDILKNYISIVQNYKINSILIDKHIKYKNKQQLKFLYKNLKLIFNWNIKNINNVIIDLSKKFNLKKYEIYMPIRITIIGIDKSPDIIYIMYILGKNQILLRIKNILKIL